MFFSFSFFSNCNLQERRLGRIIILEGQRLGIFSLQLYFGLNAIFGVICA